jgi:hypothetical protein
VIVKSSRRIVKSSRRWPLHVSSDMYLGLRRHCLPAFRTDCGAVLSRKHANSQAPFLHTQALGVICSCRVMVMHRWVRCSMRCNVLETSYPLHSGVHITVHVPFHALHFRPWFVGHSSLICRIVRINLPKQTGLYPRIQKYPVVEIGAAGTMGALPSLRDIDR